VSVKIKKRQMSFEDVTAVWENVESIYPQTLQIPMDGQAITYRLEIQQPSPQVMKTIDLIRVMKNHIYGGYYPKHAKK